MEGLRFKENIAYKWMFKWENPLMSQVLRGINWDCSMLQTPLKLWTLSTRCGPWWTSPNFFQCRPLHHAPLRRKLESHRAWRAGRMPFGRRYCSESLWQTWFYIIYIYIVYTVRMCIPKHTYAALWWGIGDALCPSASELRPWPRDGSLHHGTGIPNYPIENHQVEYEFSIAICHPTITAW